MKRILSESLFYSCRLAWERFKLAFSEERTGLGMGLTDHEATFAEPRVFEGVLKASWYGDDILLEIDGEDVDEYLIDLADRRVRVTVEVLP